MILVDKVKLTHTQYKDFSIFEFFEFKNLQKLSLNSIQKYQKWNKSMMKGWINEWMNKLKCVYVVLIYIFISTRIFVRFRFHNQQGSAFNDFNDFNQIKGMFKKFLLW